jgi:AcrR family transcriptional regulator
MAETVIRQVRSGGRSARIQAAVHEATEALIVEVGRAALTVPAIAARAGVTPSTVYRRWGGLPTLLADVAARHLRPVTDPADAPTLREALQAWVEQYADEMSSEPGRALIRDVLNGSADPEFTGRCCSYTMDQLRVISDRAVARGEQPLPLDEVVDHVVAPIMYRIIFGLDLADPAWCRRLVDRLFDDGPALGG